jgi:hypothetical protein
VTGIPGLTGSLLSSDALARVIPAALGAAMDPAGAADRRPRLRRWHRDVCDRMGPASSARTVLDRLAAPLLSQLGFTISIAPSEGSDLVRVVLGTPGPTPVALIVTPWGRDPAGAWRHGVLHGIASDARWCLCANGPSLRLLDARRTYSRRFAQFDLDLVLDDEAAFGVMWALLRAAAFAREPLLDQAVALSDQHRAAVRASLQAGVHEALTELLRAFSAAPGSRRRAADLTALFDESLVVVYRVLFLLFAEARGLVPRWHPIYRDAYTIESLRPRVERHRPPTGLWESLQAISRLAHQGCRAGSLSVPPFNGRLFSPVHAPVAESAALDDGAVGQALLALTTRPGRGGREHVSYADLGVEQLGGVYERVLDYQPGADGDRCVLVRAERRKATGSFYTPRSITEYLVRRTLAPLVRGRSADEILAIRVLDPAMGSGAFLVAACRYLAIAYEQALVGQGAVTSGDVTDAERAAFRRTVAQRCLFGVDVNPMAVQLGRLSLWLATLAADRPLTFLDHHLRTGNSLVGATLDDIARQPPGSRARSPRAVLPLFDSGLADAALGHIVLPRIQIAEQPGDTIEQVRAKERALAALTGERDPVGRWKRLADLWCAGWFGVTRVTRRAVFGALADELLGGARTLPQQVAREILGEAAAAATRERFFHWTLEFPEIFFGRSGTPLPSPGFDAIVGNPPWEMLRGDRGDAETRRAATAVASSLTVFARGSGAYRAQGEGHANLYQLFLERGLSLVRDGGRLGLVLPSGFASDHGCAALRRRLLDTTRIDTFTSVENHDGLFPIHRGLKFLLVSATRGETTAAVPYRSGIRSPEALEQLADEGIDANAVAVPRRLMSAASGEDQMAIPELRTRSDLDIVSAIVARVPPLGGAEGWNVRFGRELNATDDRPRFVESARRRAGDLPIVEGKQIQPFVADVSAARFHIARKTAGGLLPGRPFDRARLAYRDVAAATNRLTLIAAIVPAGVVTTHTLFCLKTAIDEASQRCLCALMNSYVANYLVRMRVGTHVSVAIVERVPVPVPDRASAAFGEVAALAGQLGCDRDDGEARARLQGLAAALYGVRAPEYRHILDTFPLVELAERRAAAAAFDAIAG